MKFTSPRRKSRMLPVDMTPTIDIVFQLLIFFLTTAQLAQFSRADLELPTESGEAIESAEEAGLIINIHPDGTIEVAGKALDDESFAIMTEELAMGMDADALLRLRPLVRADKAAPAERLNRVLELLQRAGVVSVRIATSPGKG